MRFEEGLGRIASILGVPLSLDKFTEEHIGTSSSARVCIDIQTDCTWPPTVPFYCGEDGKESLIKLEYLWIPITCKQCKLFGHLLDTCESSTLIKGNKMIEGTGQDQPKLGGQTAAGDKQINKVEEISLYTVESVLAYIFTIECPWWIFNLKSGNSWARLLNNFSKLMGTRILNHSLKFKSKWLSLGDFFPNFFWKDFKGYTSLDSTEGQEASWARLLPLCFDVEDNEVGFPLESHHKVHVYLLLYKDTYYGVVLYQRHEGFEVGSYGGIVCNESGAGLFVYSFTEPGMSTSFHELKSILRGLELCIERNQGSIEVATMSDACVAYVKQMKKPHWSCKHLVQSISLAVTRLSYFSICVVAKKVNEGAFYMASNPPGRTGTNSRSLSN
ncbi:hypothetical protein GIB67_023302 [Kingdonia uniflora]|uniref:RNase H type-1 domain-containing protein n=1 Tax=Kingdonia uniflora TaxID=39325 RepID=A0A7J7KX54_9MAGN|nr:hypothetical protein GIB67_023302 [Kingdonia uniflora]